MSTGVRSVTEADKLACARRELSMRRKVYPHWVKSGRMTQAQADHQIACMESIVEDYRKICEGERLI